MRTPPPPAPERAHWTLDPAVVFLNHGSFGACPAPVLAEQQRLRAQLEAEPVRFFAREAEGLLDAARARLATFLGARPQDLAWVPNATTGVSTVLRALRFAPGDELLVTDQEYNASRNALEFAAAQWGARVVVAPTPWPVPGPEAVLEAVRSRFTPRTRLLLVDHVTSQTGLVLPLAELVREAHARGVDVLVDGAHGPGQVPVDLGALGAAYYTGNLHKWVCAPKGAAFLHVREDRQERVAPLVISHGYNSPRTDRTRFERLFAPTATDDLTPFLCVPTALDFLASLVPGGWPALREANRQKALAARALLCARLGTAPPCPDAMVGSMAAVPLPDGFPDPPAPPLFLDPLQDRLLLEHGIEVPVVPWPRPPRRHVRVSAQLYNAPAEYAHLADALEALLGLA